MTTRTSAEISDRNDEPVSTLDEVERAVAATADLVLKLSALADRYETSARSAQRVALLRETVQRGRWALLSTAGP